MGLKVGDHVAISGTICFANEYYAKLWLPKERWAYGGPTTLETVEQPLPNLAPGHHVLFPKISLTAPKTARQLIPEEPVIGFGSAHQGDFLAC